jgi:hypothetical protein
MAAIRFRPRLSNSRYSMLFVHGHKRMIILKARQLGFSTGLCPLQRSKRARGPGSGLSE